MSNHMRMAGALTLATFGLVLFATAGAQVAPVRIGDVLDANPQIGSGGNNVVNGGSGGVNSQLYITGQVTGLSRFRGQVPYFASDQLRLTLSTGGIELFRQQSVGSQDVLQNRVYQTSPYLSNYTTAYDVGGLTAGLGGVVPRTAPISSSVADKLYINATADYSTLLQTPDKPLRVQYTGTIAIAPISLRTGADSTVRPSDGSVFGTPSGDERQNLERDLAELARVDSRIKAQIDRDANKPSDQTDDSSRTDIQMKPGGPEPANPNLDRDKVPKDRTTNKDNTRDLSPNKDNTRDLPTDRLGQGDRQVRGTGDRAGMPSANQDVFLDLLVNLQQKRANGNKIVLLTEENPWEEGPAAKTPQPRTGGPTVTGTTGMLRKIDNPLVEYTPETGLTVHGLAGRSSDVFNRYMQKGEAKLKEGKCYDAAGFYSLAVQVDESNPLARVGWSLALLGAGEPLSASAQLRKAMGIFPPIMESNVDLAAMFDKRLLRAQQTLLESQAGDIQGAKEPSVVLMATWLNYNERQFTRARAYAKILKDVAGDDKLLIAYADYVLTGQKPTSQPATQPAK